MQFSERSKIGFHAAEAVYAVLVLAWYVLPFFSPSLGGFNPLRLADTLFGSSPTQGGAWALVTVLAYAVPVICAWKLAAFFLEKQLPVLADPDRFFSIALNLISSGIVVALVVVHLVDQAHSAKYFSALPPLTYVVAAISLVYNGFHIVMLIASNSRRDEAYREYLEFRRATEDSRSVLSALQRQGIQRRLLRTFVPMILVVILVLSFFLLQDFSRTIITAVNTNGQTIAEKIANGVKSNPGDNIYLDDLFAGEAKTNNSPAAQASPYRFNALSYYRRDTKNGGFVVGASTDHQLVNRREMKDLTLTQTVNRYNPVTESYEFLAPVTLSKTFIGYVMVDYARDVIYEPFFRTQVKVFVIAALFMYISIFLIFLFGRNIVFPILFLRMSVNSIAEKLTSMIKGKLRFSPELLQYNDRVGTRTAEEIKQLSVEVNHMTTVIRGVIPYVSVSTLKHSERETPTTERRNLTFLFTDIRGFTSISETMSPDKVVEMLNHYLDLQAGIIQENGGDVDKFVGDEVMAMFEGPKRDQNACKASIEIRKAMAQEKELAKVQGRDSVSIGIGINAGPVVHGSMGAKDRMDFTSIGDTVNLAARLEGTNKEYATKTLITAAVYDKVKDTFLCREIDLVTVKGKTQPVRIYELLQESKGSSEKLERMKKVFEESLALYRKQKWDAAAKGFATLAKDYKDETSQIFLGRVAEFKEDPPPKDWDGVFHRTTK